MCVFSNQRVFDITEQLPEYQSEMERNQLDLQAELFRPLRSRQCSSIYKHIYIFIVYIIVSAKNYFEFLNYVNLKNKRFQSLIILVNFTGF